MPDPGAPATSVLSQRLNAQARTDAASHPITISGSPPCDARWAGVPAPPSFSTRTAVSAPNQQPIENILLIVRWRTCAPRF